MESYKGREWKSRKKMSFKRNIEKNVEAAAALKFKFEFQIFGIQCINSCTGQTKRLHSAPYYFFVFKYPTHN